MTAMVEAVACSTRSDEMVHHFTVHGLASPDLPLRVLNLFAQRDLCFDAASVARAGDRYVVTVSQAGLTVAQAGLLLEKMRVMVLVDRAELRAGEALHVSPLTLSVTGD